MANEENIIPHRFTSDQDREKAAKNGKKGGINSGKARRENKTTRAIANEILNENITKIPQIKKLAEKIGIESDKNIKYLFTLVTILNSFKNADLADLEKLQRILGEHDEEKQDNGILNELAEYLKQKNEGGENGNI